MQVYSKWYNVQQNLDRRTQTVSLCPVFYYVLVILYLFVVYITENTGRF